MLPEVAAQQLEGWLFEDSVGKVPCFLVPPCTTVADEYHDCWPACLQSCGSHSQDCTAAGPANLESLAIQLPEMTHCCVLISLLCRACHP